MGIPTVGAAGANVVDYARGYDFEYTNGMPIRYVGFPFPVAGQPKSVHHSYVFERNEFTSRLKGPPRQITSDRRFTHHMR